MEKIDNPIKRTIYQRFAAKSAQWIGNEWSWIFSVIFIVSWIFSGVIQLSSSWQLVMSSSIFFVIIFIFLTIDGSKQNVARGEIDHEKITSNCASNDNEIQM